MTRQVALGAVVAFFATVIALSVWEPKAVVAPPAAVAAPAPVPVAMPPAPKSFKPEMLRPEGMVRHIRAPIVVAQPVVAQPVVAQPLVAPAVDAGTP